MLRTKLMERDNPQDLISISLLQEYIRQDDLYDEQLMMIICQAAIDQAEKYTNRYFTEALMLGTFKEYKEQVILDYDSNEVVSVQAKNPSTGEYEDIDYSYNIVTDVVEISKQYKYYTDFNINYKCGYKSGQLPSAIMHGILMLFGTMYEVREEVSYGVNAYSVPFKATMFLDSYRLHTI